jgi:hypothetical protein
VRLPELGPPYIKAKIDTGARSSSLHAYDVETFVKGGNDMVRFRVHPKQRDSARVLEAEAPLFDMRQVRNSGGRIELRPVVFTVLELLGERWPIELTLTRRDVMGFRMLLGRQAIRGRFLVHPGRSYFGGRPPRRKKSSRGRST